LSCTVGTLWLSLSVQIFCSFLFQVDKIYFEFKGELGELEFINKNFWWSRFFLIHLGCRKNLKNGLKWSY